MCVCVCTSWGVCSLQEVDVKDHQLNNEPGGKIKEKTSRSSNCYHQRAKVKLQGLNLYSQQLLQPTSESPMCGRYRLIGFFEWQIIVIKTVTPYARKKAYVKNDTCLHTDMHVHIHKYIFTYLNTYTVYTVYTYTQTFCMLSCVWCSFCAPWCPLLFLIRVYEQIGFDSKN